MAPRKAPRKDTPKTSARTITTARWQNLTLSDWLVVFQFIDEHNLRSCRRETGFSEDFCSGRLLATLKAQVEKVVSGLDQVFTQASRGDKSRAKSTVTMES